VNRVCFSGEKARTLYLLPVTYYQLPSTIYQLPTSPLDNRPSKKSLQEKTRTKKNGLAAIESGRGLVLQSSIQPTAGDGVYPLPGPTLSLGNILMPTIQVYAPEAVPIRQIYQDVNPVRLIVNADSVRQMSNYGTPPAHHYKLMVINRLEANKAGTRGVTITTISRFLYGKNFG